MKDYRTFLSEQVELNEKAKNSLSTLSGSLGGAADKANTIASTRGVTVKVDPSDVSMIKAISDRTVYNFDALLSGFEALSSYTIRPEEKANYKRTLSQLRDEDPRKMNILQELENIMVLPASADRTYRTQNVLNTLNSIATEMGQGSLSYDQVQPQTYIPGRYMNFGRGN